MKKQLFSVLLGLMIVVFAAACTPAEEQPLPAPEPENTAEEPDGTELPNPMEEMSALNFDEKLGWSINGWPEEYGFEHSFIVAGAVAEIDFLVDGNAVTFRAANDKEGDISGVYDAFADTAAEDIGETQLVMNWTEDETGLAIWYSNGFVHTLYMKSGASDDNLRKLADNIERSITIGPWMEK